ncbi:hypothetical protein H8356DRAFT_1655598 [Neocallimastix lanati (nom. inval.)]|jgi:hypothetical protein|uniref:Pyridoxamine 5'-phosphate oxidase Alr4036 family FMN-binding domain-containing protein n=1 Tax=Neocallimastix californiae TaxID=1754190 RepID=A0A1Y2AMU8_9FUNG|nr:hypothetical protein H8356DRAFT_1655598 [Neocallimastix sp. JGI-2020a]ORY23832.1 hypothetical protein LY90DRAFT_514825 [Neocallimastix californiae]|eukprot:ORY23832.1 hypothetical protein LY90DRAFT_514825 [Neocallimastix californiae]
MSENVPWSEYLQKSLHYNSINSNKEPVRIMLSSVKNGVPKVQQIVYQNLLSADQRVLIFSGATRNADLMSVVKSSNSTHVIYWDMPKTKETYILTGRIYIVAAPALSYRFGTPPRRINIQTDKSAEEFWEDERIRIWQKISSEYRASFTWPEPGIPSVSQLGNGEGSWSVYDSNTIKVPAVSNIDIGYKYKTLDAIKETSLHKSGSIVSSATSSPSIKSFGGRNNNSEIETIHNSALDNFCLLIFKVTDVDYTQRGIFPPSRIIFSSKNGNDWKYENVNA